MALSDALFATARYINLKSRTAIMIASHIEFRARNVTFEQLVLDATK